MADRNEDRNRRLRDTGNDDWDWYYYEWRYAPYRGNDYYGPDYNMDYYNYNTDYWGRNYDYSRNEFGHENDMGQGRQQQFGRSRARSQQGPYSGYGPRGYRRSDDRIEEDVNDRLTWHSQLDATDIKVAVQNGIVTLTGTVDSRADKRLAEHVAEGVPGVWDVNNQITVRNRGYYRGWREGDQGDVRQGMDVFGSDGKRVGQVKEVRETDFLIDRPMARDIYIPFDACDITGDRIQLHIPAGDVDNQGWMTPEQVESQRQKRR